MEPLSYEQVSSKLLTDLEEALLIGRSLVLLGPRYVGKRHVLKHLEGVVKDNNETTLRLRFLAETAISSEEEVRGLIEEAISEQALGGGGDWPPAGLSGHKIFAPLDALNDSARHGRGIYLFASNIDNLAHHVARRFLEGLSRRVIGGRLTAVLSGEQDLHNLMRSPKGDGDFAHKYVLQGCDREVFERHMTQYVRETNLQFKSPKHAVERLYKLTGGNLYAMRIVLWGLMEARVRGNDEKVSVAEIPQSLSLIGVPNIYGAHVFRHGTQLIACDPDSWGDLETLIRRGRVKADASKGAPSTLEMAGVAVLDTSKAQLKFASPLQQDFVKNYYDARRLGDLYAGEGQWKVAFERYASLPPSACVRPTGIEDLSQIEGAVRSLCSSLYVEAARSTEPGGNLAAIEEQFTKGSRYLLGFSEVSFWQRASSRGDEGWQLMPAQDGKPDKKAPPAQDGKPANKTRKLIASLLPEVCPAAAGHYDLSPKHEGHRQYAIVWVMDLPGDERQVAVVLSDLAELAEISRERRALGRMLLEHLARAYVHAEEINHVKKHLRWREMQVSIMNSIFGLLGRKLLDANRILEMAALGLVRIGYRRVIFCLVNPEEGWIEGVVEKSVKGLLPLKKHINVRLNDENNLQAQVVRTGEAVSVPNAGKRPGANAYLVKICKVKAYALIPIVEPGGQVIGTIHVERKDESVPTNDEMSDLRFFGRQLAVAMGQAERVNQLEKMLDKIPEPMVIVDRAGYRSYVNRPAATLFDVNAGWERDKVRRTLAEELGSVPGNVAELLEESLRKRHRLSSHYTGIGNDPEYRGAVLADFIEDWRGHISGGFLRIQDFNYLRRVFDAAKLVGASNDIRSGFHNMLEATKRLGHRWGRLYKTDDYDAPQRLISYLSYGYENAQLEREFNEGEVILADRARENHIDWRSIDRRQPVVFCWWGTKPEEVYFTPYGLKAINAPAPDQPPQIRKKRGDLWIDFPLVTPDKEFGKICLQCDKNLRPEEFEMLKILSEVATDLFQAFLLSENSSIEREKNAMTAGAGKTVATIAHNLITRFAGLSPIGGRYRLLEEKYEELKPINNDFFLGLDEAMKTAEHAKNLLGVIRPVKTKFDLVAYLRRTLPPSMPAGKLRVTADCDELEVVADSRLLGMALREMIQNSKDALPDEDELEVTVTVESRFPETDMPDGEWVRIMVKDNGPGIVPEIRERIFGEFFTHRPSREPGTGIGLDFVRRVVEAHGGTYAVNPLCESGADIIMGIRRRPEADAQEREETNYVSHTDS